MQAKRIALLAKEACEEKKAFDPIVLDLSRLNAIARFFVIVSGSTVRHIRAIAENVVKCLSEKKVKEWHTEGMDGSNWILLDYGDVIVHLFYHETRKLYNLERLWGDARRVP